MIVRNESKIIRRCLESVTNICDYVVICDTGSTDNTSEIIESYFSENTKLKGKIYHHEWINFGHNRSLSLEMAKQTGASYALCIDADMILNIHEGFTKETLTADSYLVEQNHGCLVYSNTRLMKLDRNWKCIGSTHEYYACEYPTNASKLTTLSIIDLADGGCKHDKFERDIKLLTNDLSQDPNNQRSMFYLAQSYYDTKQYEKAAEFYNKRAQAGGWIDEVYYSHFQIGNTKRFLNKSWDEIEKSYMQAWNCLPSRAEPLYELSRYCRENQMHEKGYVYGKMGLMIPFPKEHNLFIYKNVYNYQLKDEVSICAYYVQRYDESIEICKELLSLVESAGGFVPDSYVPRINNNMAFSVEKIGERCEMKKTMVLYVGYSTFDEYNTYGSEIALISACKEFSKHYNVYVFGKNCQNTLFQGVLLLNSSLLNNFIKMNEIDVMIISRYVHYFMEFPIVAKKTYIWLHDVCYHASWNGIFLPQNGKELVNNIIDKIDGIVCLTEWHKRLISETNNVDPNKITVIGYCVNEELYISDQNKNPKCDEIIATKVKYRFIYTSEVSRGLQDLVDYFHEIRKIYPKAELFVFRDKKSFHGYEKLLKEINECPYIHYGGRLEQPELIKEFMKSDVWLYPTTFTETFCNSALEALRSGCYCIASSVAALKETVGNRGSLIEGNPKIPAVKKEFMKELNKIFTDDSLKTTCQIEGTKWAQQQTKETMLDRWLELIRSS
jgi:glycosyltransferase involved in cell wall biosynthesis